MVGRGVLLQIRFQVVPLMSQGCSAETSSVAWLLIGLGFFAEVFLLQVRLQGGPLIVSGVFSSETFCSRPNKNASSLEMTMFGNDPFSKISLFF